MPGSTWQCRTPTDDWLAYQREWERRAREQRNSLFWPVFLFGRKSQAHSHLNLLPSEQRWHFCSCTNVCVCVCVHKAVDTHSALALGGDRVTFFLKSAQRNEVSKQSLQSQRWHGDDSHTLTCKQVNNETLCQRNTNKFDLRSYEPTPLNNTPSTHRQGELTLTSNNL